LVSNLCVTVTHVEGSDSDSVVLTANFIFVARDSKTGKAAPVNRLSPETAREKLLFEQAEARNNLQKRKRGGEEEEKKLKDLLAEGRIFCDMPALADRDSILLRDTSLENSLICHPQQRNIHGRIFGGFLMNRAFELAFSTAYAFAGLVPYFLEVDHVDFLRPVSLFFILLNISKFYSYMIVYYMPFLPFLLKKLHCIDGRGSESPVCMS
jgi:acyl-coenzyme A thioesterase 9